MSVASSDTACSDDDNLSSHINNLLEPELRSVLQHIALVHPEVVQVAIKHQQFLGDDMYSVMTQQVSNTSKSRTDDADEPPPLIFRHGAVVPHPSKRANTDDDFMPQPPQAGHPSLLQPRQGHHQQYTRRHHPSSPASVSVHPGLVTSRPSISRVREVSSSSVSSPTPPAPPRRHMSPPPLADQRKTSTIRLE